MERKDGMITPDQQLMRKGYALTERIAYSDDPRITVTADERLALVNFAVVGIAYCAVCPPEAVFRWRGKRHPDGSQDIMGQQLAAMRDYWRENLPTIISVGTGRSVLAVSE